MTHQLHTSLLKLTFLRCWLYTCQVRVETKNLQRFASAHHYKSVSLTKDCHSLGMQFLKKSSKILRCNSVSGVLAGSLGTSLTDSSTYLAGASAGVYALIAAHLATLVLNWQEDSNIRIQKVKLNKTSIERDKKINKNPV